MPTTTKVTFRSFEVEGENAEAVARLIRELQHTEPIAEPSPDKVQAVRERLAEVSETFASIEEEEPDDIVPDGGSTPSGALADFTPPPGPARRAPRIESDPEIRDRQRQAAANAREALAARRAAEKAAKEAATPLTPEALSAVPPVARRGRPPKQPSSQPLQPASTVDLSGDREEGDAEHGPETEPTDPHAGGGAGMRVNGGAAITPTMSSTEKQQVIFTGMRDVSQVSSSGMEAVKQTVATFGVTKIKDVPLDRLDELWAATETLCGTFNVTFPPP